jgi:hypothetical protein
MIPVRLRRAALAVLTTLSIARPILSQSPTPAGQPSGEMTRAQLTERARIADSLGRREEAFLLRTRLRDGDFEVGDHILVKYEGPGLTKDEELVVQAGRIVRLGEPLGDLSLGGVLRFEIQNLITQRVERMYKNEVVHVTPLIRLSISGAVRSQGFYHVRADLPLSDVIMKAASQDPNANMGDIVIKRGQQVLWANADVQSALSNGMTVEGLNLEPGDEIVVGTRTANRWLLVAQIGIPVMTLLVSLLLRR